MTTLRPRTYTICTLDKHIDCGACTIASRVDCTRHEPAQMLRYYRMVALFVVPALLTLAYCSLMTGAWWLAPAYVLYWAVYQIGGELFLHCRHCPFWDESSPTLECRINCGVPKIRLPMFARFLPFDPRPLTPVQRAIIQCLNAGSILLPLIAVGVTIALHPSPRGFTDPATIGLLCCTAILVMCGRIMLRYLTKKLCPFCVHFSCPMNRQPYWVIERYLSMNDCLREAWGDNLRRYAGRK
jgi:hypothetical protein